MVVENRRRVPVRTLLSTFAVPFAVLLLTAAAFWLTAFGRQRLSAAPELPDGQGGRLQVVAVIWNGDSLNPVPREPMAVAVLPGGDVLIADAGLGRVHRFGTDRRLIRSYTGAGELRYPVGVAVGDHEQVWVSDLWQRQIYRLDLAADRLDPVPAGPDGYRTPGSLFYRNGLFYVTDVGRHQVLVLRPDGELVQIVGEGPGRAAGQFSYPNALWVGEHGEILVSDSNNGRIQVFDPAGRIERILQPHRLLLPRGIVQDRRGRLHIADTLSHDVAVINPAGHIVARYGADADLTLPNGLTLDGKLLYVADRGNGRVVVWDLGDE